MKKAIIILLLITVANSVFAQGQTFTVTTSYNDTAQMLPPKTISMLDTMGLIVIITNADVTEIDEFLTKSTFQSPDTNYSTKYISTSLKDLLGTNYTKLFSASKANKSIVINFTQYLQVAGKNTITFKYSTAQKTLEVDVVDSSLKPKQPQLQLQPTQKSTVDHVNNNCCTEIDNAFYKFSYNDTSFFKYDKKKIVYVYDFNKNPSKRGFYKIKRKRNKNIDLKSDYITSYMKKDSVDYIDAEDQWQREKRTIKRLPNKRYRLDTSLVNFSKETLKARQYVQFEVVNVNKFMYDVSIADTIMDYDSQPSALFNELLIGDTTVLGGLIKNYAKALPTSQTIGTAEEGGVNESLNKQAKNNKQQTPDLLTDILNFMHSYYNLEDTMIKAFDPCYHFTCCIDRSYTGLADQLLNIKVEMASVSDSISKLNTIITSTRTYNAVSKRLTDNQNTLQPLKQPADSTKIRVLTSLISQQNDSIKKIDLSKIDQDTLPIISRLQVYAGIDSVKLPTNQDLKKMIVFINNIVEQNQMYEVDIPLSGNRLDLILSIRTKDSLEKFVSIPQYNNQPIHIQIPILWKGFVSFSSGSFIGLNTNLQNKTYAWQKVPNSSNLVTANPNYVLVESGYTLPPMGFAAFGNFEWKIGRSFGFGFSGGVGLTIETTARLAYLGGGSLFFGDLRQFAITGGFVGMQVSRLSNNWQAVVDQQINYTTADNLSYYQEFKIGGFIALSYTPFKISKQNVPDVTGK